MKLERVTAYRTPDGVDHPTADAAAAHMFQHHFRVLGAADAEAIKFAIEKPDADAETRAIRTALREIYLVAWPRASKGKPREPKAPAPGETKAEG